MALDGPQSRWCGWRSASFWGGFECLIDQHKAGSRSLGQPLPCTRRRSSRPGCSGRHQDPARPLGLGGFGAGEHASGIRRENVFGKASRSRVEDVLAIFRQRFLTEEAVTRALVVLVRERVRRRLARPHPVLPRRPSRPAAARCRHRGLGALAGARHHRHRRGGDPAAPEEVGGRRARPAASGRSRPSCGSRRASCRRCGISACCRGPSRSGSPRRTCRSTAFAYLAFYLKQHQPSGAKLVELADWKLFFLPREGVERFLFEAHQHDLLEYHAAGSVTRLTFPANTLEEYAHVLAQRAH